MNSLKLPPIIFWTFRWFTMYLKSVGYYRVIKISARKSLYTSMVISLSKFQEAQLPSQMIYTFLRVLRYRDMLLFRKFVAIDNFHRHMATSGSPSIIIHIHAFHLWQLFMSSLVHHQCLLCAKHCTVGP